MAYIASMRVQIILVCLSGFLANCAGSLSSVGPPIESEPNYRAIIAKNLRSPRAAIAAETVNSNFFEERGNIFLDPKKIGSIEIADSQRREFHNTFGWTWMTCIQAQGGEINGTFAIFIAGNTIVDARRGVLSDRCEGLSYQPLDLRPPEANQAAKKRRRESKNAPRTFGQHFFR
jgi:hypothetical protein